MRGRTKEDVRLLGQRRHQTIHGKPNPPNMMAVRQALLFFYCETPLRVNHRVCHGNRTYRIPSWT